MISIRLEDPDGAPLPAARPGQYLTLRVQPDARAGSVLRNYSLSGPPGAGYYRVTVKREPDGVASGYLHTRLAVGDQLDVAAPRGTFILDRTHAPVLLISAGIGATPVLAMLQALAEEHSDREIWWLHGARNSREHAFAAEARALLASLPNARATCSTAAPARTTSKAATSTARAVSPGRCWPSWSRPRARRTCAGPRRSWTRSAPAWPRMGIDASRIHTEPFGPAPGLTPGIAATPARAPHPPAGEPGSGPDDRVRPQQPRDPMEQRLRQPARTRRSVRRAGPLVVPHRRLPHVRDHADRRRRRVQPDPVEPPADGSALICCSQPRDDVVLDL